MRFRISSFISTKLWAHAKAITLSLPMVLVVVSESRDLHQKSQWDIQPLPPSRYQTGDILLICNRWFTLPTWEHKFYSLVSKVVQKSCWDDVGVIVQKGGVPHVLIADLERARLVPLAQFVDDRQPRGLAVRCLQPTSSEGVPYALRKNEKETLAKALRLAAVLEGEAQAAPSPTNVSGNGAVDVGGYVPPADLTSHPWRILSGSWLSSAERKYTTYAVEISLQHALLMKLRTEQHTPEKIRKEEQRLEDLKVVQGVMRKDVHWGDIEASRCIFNGALVAEWMVGMGLLPPQVPRTCKYIPADFTEKMGLIDATLSEPRVVFKL